MKENRSQCARWRDCQRSARPADRRFSKNIFFVGGTAALDVWTQERFSVDFGSQYKVTEPFSVYFNAKNLTNTALKITEGPGNDRVIQREFYGITGWR